MFDDFLTMAICALSPDPRTGKSRYEDEYLKTIERYKEDDLRHHFPKLFGILVTEMEDRFSSSSGNDVLGEYFELNLSRGKNGQYFTPFPICQLMAKSGAINREINDKPLHIIDPACGSGRMLVASSKEHGQRNHYYGIDIDHTCVKMAVINLFLNGMFKSEVMWGDALGNDFRMSYKTSFMPLGIFKTTEKEQSQLWQMQQNTIKSNTHRINTPPQLSKPDKNLIIFQKGTQAKLF